MKLFVQEAGTEAMIRRMSVVPNGSKVLSELSLIEARSATRRLERSGKLSPEDASFALRGVDEEAARVTVWPVSTQLVREAGALIDRSQLRTLDSLQLATAVVVRRELQEAMVFVSCDVVLLETAKGEGFETWNPLAAI